MHKECNSRDNMIVIQATKSKANVWPIKINKSGLLACSATKSVINDGRNMRVFAHEVNC